MTTLEVAPGDVLAVLSDRGVWSWLVRIGAWFQHKPSLVNHVVIVSHQDAMGRWIGISGQPGGVVLCDCTPYLIDRRTRGNHGQPRTDVQVAQILASAAKSLGIAYDWVGIAEDTFNAMHFYDMSWEIDHLWRWPTDDHLLPGHVVCSSLAALLYEQVGLPHPSTGRERTCDPADWWNWGDRKEWASAAPPS